MNILIVGLGSIGRKHVEALKALNINANIFALRSTLNADNLDGIQNVYEIDDQKIAFNFAIISNPTHLHFEYIEKLASRQIPLFIEKPAVHSLAKVDYLVELIKKNNLVTYIACNLRFHPCIVFLKNKINAESVRINEVNVYCGSYLPEWRVGIDFRTNYSANARMGGGVHLDLFHELDYVTWLFGLPNKHSSVLKSNSSLEIDAYDYANYTLEYENFTTSVILNYYRRKPKRIIEIVYHHETIIIDLIKNEITNDSNQVLFSTSDFSIKDSYVSQLEYFVNCLKKKQVPMNSFAESIKILKICLNDK